MTVKQSNETGKTEIRMDSRDKELARRNDNKWGKHAPRTGTPSAAPGCFSQRLLRGIESIKDRKYYYYYVQYVCMYMFMCSIIWQYITWKKKTPNDDDSVIITVIK